MPGRDICMHLRSPPAASCAERRIRSSSAADFRHLSTAPTDSVGTQLCARLTAVSRGNPLSRVVRIGWGHSCSRLARGSVTIAACSGSSGTVNSDGHSQGQTQAYFWEVLRAAR